MRLLYVVMVHVKQFPRRSFIASIILVAGLIGYEERRCNNSYGTSVSVRLRPEARFNGEWRSGSPELMAVMRQVGASQVSNLQRRLRIYLSVWVIAC